MAAAIRFTPKIHHSTNLAETNSNYGNVLTIYDRMRLGRATCSTAREVNTVGLMPQLSWQQSTAPDFLTRRLRDKRCDGLLVALGKRAPDKKVRKTSGSSCGRIGRMRS